VRVAIVTTSYPAFEGDGCGHFVETEARQRAIQDDVFVVTAGKLHPPGPPPRSARRGEREWIDASRVAMAALVVGCGARTGVLSDTSVEVTAPDAAVRDGADETGPCGSEDAGGGGFVVLASGQDHPSSIAVDCTSVYWTNSGSGFVMKVPRGGGTPVTLALGVSPGSIAVDATRVYFGDVDDVLAVPLDGGAPVTLASRQQGPEGIVANATSLYWVNNGALMTMPLEGGGVGGRWTALATWKDPNLGAAIALDATNVYWSQGGTGTVMKMPVGGGAPTTLATRQGEPGGIAVNASSVYWLNLNIGGTLVKAPLGGGAPRTLASRQWDVEGIAAGAGGVYWASKNGDVMKSGLGGGRPETLAVGKGRSGAIAVDATSVYWTTDDTDGTVMKVTPN
jgi:hypothetical protein